MKNWCGITDEKDLDVRVKSNIHSLSAQSARVTLGSMDDGRPSETIADKQAATDLFEGMIVSEGKRLQAEGKNGLVILPGVQNLLASVSPTSPHYYVSACDGYHLSDMLGSRCRMAKQSRCAY